VSEQHEVMAELVREAHLLHSQPRAVAAYVVAELERLRGSGEPWVDEQLARFAVDGAMKRCASWRAAQRTEALTKRGKKVEVPAWAGVPVRDANGVVQHHQLRFEDLSIEQVEASVHRMAKQRNTLSADLSVRERVLEYMRANPTCARAGDAMRALGIAA
jgi:hypothetical protein